MSGQPEINQKKLILSTTEVSKLLLSKGRRKINESLLSHGAKTLNNIDLTDLTSQINIKLSKENEITNNTIMVDQSSYKPFGEKSILYNNKPRNILDRSSFLGGIEKFNQKDNLNNNNILNKLDKSQIGNVFDGGDQNLDIKTKKKLIRLDSTEMGLDKNNNIKISNIINNYFPYENENNLNLENNTKLKNFLVIFYFTIENSTFVLIRKLDKKLIPLYFWNREEDAKQFGINYSQVNTPGIYFKNFENFKETFKNHGHNFIGTINKMTTILKEKKREYEENIKKIKNEYELKIKELNDNNEILNSKIDEYKNDNNLKNKKIKELSNYLNDLNEEMDELKLINEKLKHENRKLKKNLNTFNKNKENMDNNNKIKSVEKKPKQNNKFIKTFFKSKSKMDLNNNKSVNLNKNKYLSGKISELNNYIYENHISESKYEKENLNDSDKDEENSFPKLEEYNIENDEEEKIDKIRNVGNIKTYGERKRFYQNYNSVNTHKKNNFFISIKESSDKKERKDLDSYKNKYQSEKLDYNKSIQESQISSSNKYESQEEEESSNN